MLIGRQAMDVANGLSQRLKVTETLLAEFLETFKDSKGRAAGNVMKELAAFYPKVQAAMTDIGIAGTQPSAKGES